MQAAEIGVQGRMLAAATETLEGVQAAEIEAQGRMLAAAARRRRRSFASKEAALQHLKARPGFRRFSDAVLAAYVQHDMQPQPGAHVALIMLPASSMIP